MNGDELRGDGDSDSDKESEDGDDLPWVLSTPEGRTAGEGCRDRDNELGDDDDDGSRHCAASIPQVLQHVEEGEEDTDYESLPLGEGSSLGWKSSGAVEEEADGGVGEEAFDR